MSKYRNALPQSEGRLFLADGGIETTLLFHEGLALPEFAAFPLLKSMEGTRALRKYFSTYADIAARFGLGLVLESPTWRASSDWAARLGTGRRSSQRQTARQSVYSKMSGTTPTRLEPPSSSVGASAPGETGKCPTTSCQRRKRRRSSRADRGVCRLRGRHDWRHNHELHRRGCRYRIRGRARRHAGGDLVHGQDGCNLPTRQSLRTAIEQVDDATSGYPAYYMLNCAHPTHFEDALNRPGPIGGADSRCETERVSQESRGTERRGGSRHR